MTTIIWLIEWQWRQNLESIKSRISSVKNTEKKLMVLFRNQGERLK